MAILYSKNKITEMVSDLDRYGTTMKRQIDELEGAATAFRANLKGDEAIANFDTTHAKLTGELSDTLQKLDALAVKVEEAFHRIVGADGKIGDGFASIL
ncbi:type VII secretion protein EsxR [Nocardia sp. NPDC049190]|uniref:type VII secretion protein EsxR n=1 Tax=Nocardia sp. NPDC049190 TaxID=3155650 RepID=UPI003410F148